MGALEAAVDEVAARSDEAAGATCTVLPDTTDGAWPVARRLRELLSG